MSKQLKVKREELGLTQAEIAGKVKISVVGYQNYEYDKREPGVRTAIRVAEVLGVQEFKDFKNLFGAVPVTEKPDSGKAVSSHGNNTIHKKDCTDDQAE